jgi:hypothetical protein
VPSPIELFPEKPVVMPSQEEQQQQLQAAKPAIYRPPGARGKPPSTFKLVHGFKNEILSWPVCNWFMFLFSMKKSHHRKQ